MYLTNLEQAVNHICIMAMWFERARSFAAAGWEERHTLPPFDMQYTDAWRAGWEKGADQRRRRLAAGRNPDPLGAIIIIGFPTPRSAAEWV